MTYICFSWLREDTNKNSNVVVPGCVRVEWEWNGMRSTNAHARNVNFVITHICTLSSPTLTPSPPSRRKCPSHRGLTLEHVSTVELGIARDAEALS